MHHNGSTNGSNCYFPYSMPTLGTNVSPFLELLDLRKWPAPLKLEQPRNHTQAGVRPLHTLLRVESDVRAGKTGWLYSFT